MHSKSKEKPLDQNILHFFKFRCNPLFLGRWISSPIFGLSVSSCGQIVTLMNLFFIRTRSWHPFDTWHVDIRCPVGHPVAIVIHQWSSETKMALSRAPKSQWLRHTRPGSHNFWIMMMCVSLVCLGFCQQQLPPKKRGFLNWDPKMNDLECKICKILFISGNLDMPSETRI